MVQKTDFNLLPGDADRNFRRPTHEPPASLDDSGLQLDNAFMGVFQREQTAGLIAIFKSAIWPEAKLCLDRAESEFKAAAAMLLSGRASEDQLLARAEAIDSERSKFRDIFHSGLIEATVSHGIVTRSEMADLEHRVHRAQRFFVDLSNELLPVVRTEIALVSETNLDPDFVKMREEHGATEAEFCAGLERVFDIPEVEHIPWLSKELGGLILRKQAQRPEAAGKNISIACRCQDEEIHLKDARAFLDAVFGELLLNAIDAVPDKGGKIDCRVWCNDEMLNIRISDNGPGMSRAITEQIFNPGFTTKKNGTGSGLAIIQNLVELRAGEITVISEEGVGSSFTVSVPLQQPATIPTGTDS